MTGPDSEGLQAEAVHIFERANFKLGKECTTLCGIRYAPTGLHPAPTCEACETALGKIMAAGVPGPVLTWVADSGGSSPVVPSVGAVPVEDDCWFGDDPNTVGTAAAQNRVWCVQCADWTDQAVAHDTDHRRIAEGDLAGFAARVWAEERQRLADLILPHHWKTSQVWGGVRREACGRCSYGDGVQWLWPCPTRQALTGEAPPEPDSAIFAAGSAVPVATPEPCHECESEGRNCTAHGGRAGIPVTTRTEMDTCSKCRHAAHGPICFNMASDNDCACSGVQPDLLGALKASIDRARQAPDPVVNTYCRNGLHSVPAGSECPSCGAEEQSITAPAEQDGQL